MKIALLLAVVLSILITFQNCGESARMTGIFADESIASEDGTCATSPCFQQEELLWLKIREYEPYNVDFETVGNNHFYVGGQCGIGNFENHFFSWELQEGFGAQTIVGRGFAEARCHLGQFQVPISVNVPGQGAQPNKRYQLLMELKGVDSTGQEYTNPMPVNKASLDIIYIQ